MRILLLARSFNSLTQRLFVELSARGHELAVEFDIADSVTEEAVALFAPELIVAPFMKRAIPASVWTRHVCLIVHPGPVGDRGPSALDWAIHDGVAAWGVTVLQAEAEMDAGPVWASATFALRAASKSSLYRHEVTEAAVEALLAAVERLRSGEDRPRRVAGKARPLMTQDVRRIDWLRDDTASVLRKIRAADGAPGVRDELFGVPVFLFDARPAAAANAVPGTVFARNGSGLLRATVDGAVWIGHGRRDEADAFKLPLALVFADQHAALPEIGDVDEIRYEEHGEAAATVGVLHFAFYNGAMSTAQCERLLAAYRQALTRPTRALVLAGGPDFFSNGIHLNVIEAAASPADESMRNIEAIDEVCRAILETTDRITLAALQGSAGAGGCFLAFACDEVWARPGVLLNPHYRNMGNLFGSEYWTYTLPRRLRQGSPRSIMDHRLPIAARQAQSLGLVDVVLDTERAQFIGVVTERARALVADPTLSRRIAAKGERRAREEAEKPLARYREEELVQMRRNFYGFDPSYHYARSNFVRKVPHAWTPRHLAVHRGGPPPSKSAST